jgi:hypothetical protein
MFIQGGTPLVHDLICPGVQAKFEICLFFICPFFGEKYFRVPDYLSSAKMTVCMARFRGHISRVFHRVSRVFQSCGYFFSLVFPRVFLGFSPGFSSWFFSGHFRVFSSGKPRHIEHRTHHPPSIKSEVLSQLH